MKHFSFPYALVEYALCDQLAVTQGIERLVAVNLSVSGKCENTKIK